MDVARVRSPFGGSLLVLALVVSVSSAEPSEGRGLRMGLPGAEELERAARTELVSRGPLEGDGGVVLGRADSLADAIPALEYDVVARADALGAGIEPVFAFVRDRIGFEPYPGVLRGAQGTYLARAGNAVDRALLLARMLSHKGVEVRYARGKPSTDLARRLLARTFEPVTSTTAAPAEHPVDTKPAEQILGRLRSRAARDYAGLRAALGDSMPAGAADEATLLAEISDHWWVQARVGEEWVDLDPSLPDAVPGKALFPAASTPTQVADESRQRITFRVVVETLEGDSLGRTTVLEHTGAVVDLLDRQIVLAHAQGGTGGLAGGLGAGVAASAGGEGWTPVLLVDGVRHPGSLVSFTESAAGAGRGAPPRSGLGGAFGGGGALGGAARLLVAEWLELEIAFPDGRRDLTRRVLFDRAGPAWRASSTRDPKALRPFDRAAGSLVAPQTIHAVFLTAGRHDLHEYAAASQVYCRIDRALAESPDRGFSFRVWPFLLQSFALPALSDHVVVPALNDRPDVRLYADSPRVFLASMGPREEGTEVVYDLRRDRLRGVARDAAARRALAERRLWFATLEGALEHEMMTDTSVARGGDASSVESTSALSPSHGRLVVLAAGKEVPKDASPDPDTTLRLQEALRAGVTVVLPRPAEPGTTPAGWWEVAADGHVHAVLGHGNASMGRVPRRRRPPTGGGQNPGTRVWDVPEKAGRLGGDVNLPGEPPRRRPNFGMDWYKKHRGKQMPPTEEKEGGGAPEYTGVTKETAKIVLILVTPLLAEHLLEYAFTSVAAQVEDALSAAYLADRMGT
jgi:hypothetical protein